MIAGMNVRHVGTLCAGQGLNDATLANLAVRAIRQHPAQLGPKRHELTDAPVDLAKMADGDLVDVGTGLIRALAHRQKFPYGFDREAQFAGASNEIEASDLGEAVPPLVALRARRRRYEPNALVEADRRRLDAGTPRQLTNCDNGYLVDSSAY